MKKFVFAMLTIFLITQSAGWAAEWLPASGNWVDGVVLYSAKIEKDSWQYGKLICWTSNGDFLVRKADNSYILISTKKHAVLISNLWVKTNDPAFDDRKVSTCKPEQMIPLLE